MSDFRPISLLPLPSKILERIVLSSVKDLLINIYGPNQFGFRPGSSTLLAHLLIHDYVTRQLDLVENSGVVLITFDMKKAFDSLSHACLLDSLAEGGLPRNFISWIKSFLQPRRQRVLIDGVLSSNVVNVTSGVPQGSVLSPYLFASHMRSLEARLPVAQMIKFADDVTLLCPYRTKDSIQSIVQTELSNMATWCSEHGLSLNDKKTKLLVFSKPRVSHTLDNQFSPSPSSSLNILGVTFNEALNWDAHVDAITKSASRRIHVLRYLKRIPFVTKNDLLRVYQGYILSILEHNAPVFVGISKKNNEKLERISKRCHRIICGQECDCEEFPSLTTRRVNLALKTFYRMQNPTHLLHSLIPHKLPYSQHFYIAPTRTERRLNSFIPFCCIESNSKRKPTTPL